MLPVVHVFVALACAILRIGGVHAACTSQPAGPPAILTGGNPQPVPIGIDYSYQNYASGARSNNSYVACCVGSGTRSCMPTVGQLYPSGSPSPMLPYGPVANDTKLGACDDCTFQFSLTGIGSPQKNYCIPYFGQQYCNCYYIANNALLSFGFAVPAFTPERLPTSVGVPFIAVYYMDLDTRNGYGAVWTHLTTNASELLNHNAALRASFVGTDSFVPTLAITTTWDAVGYFGTHGDLVSTFQLVLLTDQVQTYAMFNYGYKAQQVVRGTHPSSVNSYAQVGFDAGDGVHYYAGVGSFSNSMRDLWFLNKTEPGIPGRQAYRIDQATIMSSPTAIACSSSPCTNGAQCVNVDAGFTCSCVKGFIGLRCETDFDECSSLPCQNGGTCTDQIGNFTCACALGFRGKRCETNIDDCASFPCWFVGFGPVCVDGVNSFNCVCGAGFSGSLCQTDLDECVSRPCGNGGTCIDQPNSFRCQCANGFSGVLCQSDIDECASQPCANSGTCADQTNAFTCTCQSGYSGAQCQTNINECSSAPCHNAGSCVDAVAGWSCNCASGYSGLVCQTDVSECASQPCVNGGTCVDAVNRFTCACVSGYSGLTCQTEIDECSSAPCANAGTCTDGVNLFTCACAAGYLGTTCQTDVNECASNPCVNGGTCEDRANGFKCLCLPNYGGALCQSILQACASSPCRNGADCVENSQGFACTCIVGFAGVTCETNVNECASNPCVNGGTCIDAVNGYGCNCVPGFVGVRCETDSNECASAPCTNGGTCVDQLNSFHCECVNGTVGVRCQTDVDECASAPCRNGGTCVDGLNGFTCFCPGFNGINCATDVNECENAMACAGVGVACVNTFGNFSCVAVQHGSLRPRVFPELANQRLTFVLSTAPAVLDLNAFDISIVSTATEFPPLRCSKLMLTNTSTLQSALSTVRVVGCNFTGIGFGVGVQFVLSLGGEVLPTNETIAFPPPELIGGTIRANNQSAPRTAALLRTDALAVTVFIDAQFLVPNQMVVTFGSVTAPDRYRCTVDPVLCTESLLACTTTSGAEGGNNRFTVSVGGFRVVSSDTISFPVIPVITRVSGCELNLGNTTTNCPTAGSVSITIEGRNLLEPISISLNAVDCPLVTASVDGSSVVCTLPEGTGSLRPLALVSRGVSSDAFNSVSYRPPTVHSISGCDVLIGTYAPAIRDCARTGSGAQRVFITGSDFGAGGATVLIGGGVATDVKHESSNPHGLISFLYSSGVGTGLSVVVLQLSGSIGPSNATFSYVECQPSQYSVGISCLPCTGSGYTDTFDAPACLPCPAGAVSGPEPSAGCTPCAPGTYAVGGTSACLNCSIGSAQSAAQQDACTPCQAGSYSASNGAERCSTCVSGTYSDRPGMTACVECVGIRFQFSQGQTSCQTCDVDKYYRAGLCEFCPRGSACSSDGIFARAGYFVYTDEHSVLKSQSCLPGFCVECPSADPNAGPSTNASVVVNPALEKFEPGMVFSCCSANRPMANENALCGRCTKPDYFLFDGACICTYSQLHCESDPPYVIRLLEIDCTQTDGGLVFLILIMLWTYVTVFHRLAQISRADTRIFLDFVQFVALFVSTRAGSLSIWISVFNFNIFKASGSTCIIPFTDMQRLASGIFGPLLAFVFLCFNLGIHYVLWRLFHNGRCRYWICVTEQNPSPLKEAFGLDLSELIVFNPVIVAYQRTALALLVSAYLSFAETVLQFFSCSTFGDDKYMSQYPAISCLHDSEYRRLYPLFVVLTVIVTVLPLALFARLYQLDRAGRLKRDAVTMVVYGAVTDSYARKFYFWECVILLRRLVVSAIALNAYVDNSPQKFTYLTLSNIVVLVLHFLARPYSLLVDNFMASLSIVCQTVLTIFLIPLNDTLPVSTVIGLSAMCVSIGALFVFRIGSSRIDEVRRKSRTESAGGGSMSSPSGGISSGDGGTAPPPVRTAGEVGIEQFEARLRHASRAAATNASNAGEPEPTLVPTPVPAPVPSVSVVVDQIELQPVASPAVVANATTPVSATHPPPPPPPSAAAAAPSGGDLAVMDDQSDDQPPAPPAVDATMDVPDPGTSSATRTN